MKIKTPKQNCVSFGSLDAGTVFEKNGKFFLKTYLLPNIDNRGNGVDAVDLNDNTITSFSDITLVHPLNAELVLTEKIEEK